LFATKDAKVCLSILVRAYDSDRQWRLQEKEVFGRRWFSVAVWLGALLHAWQAPVFGQQNPVTADQVIANYVLAIGG
jgi:hypothetical protein